MAPPCAAPKCQFCATVRATDLRRALPLLTRRLLIGGDEHRLIRRGVIDAERAAGLRLRGHGEINDESWRRMERDLDLEELRMEA